MNSKYNLMLCELHHPSIHGKDANSDLNIETHYLVYDRYYPLSGEYLDDTNNYNTDDNYDSDDEEDYENGVSKIYADVRFLRDIYSDNWIYDHGYVGPHPTIRNFHHIVNRQHYIQPELGQYIILPTQEAIAILKTFWLRIIQKKWKKIYQERKRVISKRSGPSSLYHKQIYGKWPEDCDYLPGLNGLFYAVL